MTTSLGELLRRKLEQDKKVEKRAQPLTTVVEVSNTDSECPHVAVVLADYGGWFTRHGIEDLLYDPYLVHMVQEKESYMEEDYDRPGWTVEQKNKWEDDVIGYCRRTYPDAELGVFECVLGLAVRWVRVGRRFVVSYDGGRGEYLMFEDTMGWLDAGRRSV